VRTLITVVLSLLAAAAVALPATETAYYRIELSPTGSFVAIGELVYKGNAVLFHAYPDGKLMSLRKADVRKVSPITAQEAAAPARKDLVPIGNLAMQGGGTQAAGAGNSARPSTAPPARASRPATSGPSVIPVEGGLAITTSAPPK